MFIFYLKKTGRMFSITSSDLPPTTERCAAIHGIGRDDIGIARLDRQLEEKEIKDNLDQFDKEDFTILV